jgi:hypothetical protein
MNKRFIEVVVFLVLAICLMWMGAPKYFALAMTGIIILLIDIRDLLSSKNAK